MVSLGVLARLPKVLYQRPCRGDNLRMIFTQHAPATAEGVHRHRTRQHVWDRDGTLADLDGDHAAGVVKLTGLLRTSHGGDKLSNWPADMRIYAGARERPSAGAKLCALEEAG